MREITRAYPVLALIFTKQTTTKAPNTKPIPKEFEKVWKSSKPIMQSSSGNKNTSSLFNIQPTPTVSLSISQSSSSSSCSSNNKRSNSMSSSGPSSSGGGGGGSSGSGRPPLLANAPSTNSSSNNYKQPLKLMGILFIVFKC